MFALSEHPLGYAEGPLDPPVFVGAWPDSPLLHAYKKRVVADASSLIVFRGPANVAVSWSLTYGLGDIEPLSTSTDDQGVACAVYRPNGTVGTAVVGVSYGA